MLTWTINHNSKNGVNIFFNPKTMMKNPVQALVFNLQNNNKNTKTAIPIISATIDLGVRDLAL
jgi:hypothetical protein